jgi:6,7-dimethyl-8-ribityllumazine synthase
MNTLEGKLTAAGLRVAIVVARFNSFINDQLVAGALDTLRRLGAKDEDVTLAYVPGAFEIPALLRTLALSDDFDAAIALGCVIRGATPHFDYVAGHCARGVGQVSIEAAERGVAVSFGVLTTDNIDQAIERAGTKAGNKGADAALAAVEMAGLFAQRGARGKGKKR